MKIPQPPIKNMADFIVFVFVTIVAITLLAAAVGVFIDAIVDPDGDRSQIINMLADVMTTLIGSLVGFIAGKGQGHAEAREQQHEEDQQRRREEEKNSP